MITMPRLAVAGRGFTLFTRNSKRNEGSKAKREITITAMSEGGVNHEAWPLWEADAMPCLF